MDQIEETLVEDVVASDESDIPPPAPTQTVQVMVDLETWGNGNKAAPVSLGACLYDENAIYDRFHVGIDPASCQQLGLDIEADTVLWWMQPEQRAALDEWLALSKVDIGSALMAFTQWLNDSPYLIGAIWGNGATFDNIVLRSAYKAVGLEYPVTFRQDLCFRTMRKLMPDLKVEQVGTTHNALDDAIFQARYMQAIWRQLRAPADTVAALTAKMQAYLPPDSGISEHEFVNDVIGLLDPGPAQA